MILDKMPSQEMIDGFKGLIDFYYFRGRVVARTYPRRITKTDAWILTKNSLIATNKAWQSIPKVDRQAFSFMALYASMTNRDAFSKTFMKTGAVRGLYELDDIKKSGSKVKIVFKIVQGFPPAMMWNYAPYEGPCMFVVWRLRAEVQSCFRILQKVFPVFRSQPIEQGILAGNKIKFTLPYNFNWLYFCLDDPMKLSRYSTGVYHFKL